MNKFSIIGSNTGISEEAVSGLTADNELLAYADEKWVSKEGNGITFDYNGLTHIPKLLEVGNGKRVSVTTKQQIIDVKGKSYQAAIVIVDPVDVDVIENDIYIGGFAINTPEHYRNLMPFAAFGKRQIFINLLGAGGDGFAEANISAFGEESIASVASHLDILRQQLERVLTTEVRRGKPINLTGMSYGGFLLLHVLNMLRPSAKRNIQNVVLDDALMPKDLPLGVVNLVKLGVMSALNGAAGVASGLEGRLSEEFVSKLFGVPDNFVPRVTRSNFPANGGLLSLASSTLGAAQIASPTLLYARPTNARIISPDLTQQAIVEHFYANNQVSLVTRIVNPEPYDGRHVLMPTLSGPSEVLKAYPAVKLKK